MDIHQVESSIALLLPELVALLAALSDTNDTSGVLLLKQISSLQTRLKSLQSSVAVMEGANRTLAQQLDRYDCLLQELLKRNQLLHSYLNLSVFNDS
jgi:uncharacterized protein involved in exopolysaccharide biosynthesis